MKKMNNEMLVKQRFWFLLPVAMILVLVGFFMLRGPRGAAALDWNTAKTNDEDFKKIITTKIQDEANIKKIREATVRAEQKKLDLWVLFYDLQNHVVREPPPDAEKAANPATGADGGQPKLRLPKIDGRPRNPLIRWPETGEFKPGELAPYKGSDNPVRASRKLEELDFGEPFPRGEITDKFPDAFLTVYPEMLKIIDWVDEMKGTGSVQALDANSEPPGRGKSGRRTSRDAALDQMLKLPAGAENLELKAVHFEEVWTLLEEAAVRRELLLALGQVNKLMGDMRNEWTEIPYVPVEEKPADKDKPADPNQPASTKPAPTKPAATKPTASKPAAVDTKPAISTKPESSTLPKPEATVPNGDFRAGQATTAPMASAPATKPSGVEPKPPDGTDKPGEAEFKVIDRRIFGNQFSITLADWDARGPKWKIDEDGNYVLDKQDAKTIPVWYQTPYAWKFNWWFDLGIVKEKDKLTLEGIVYNESPQWPTPEGDIEVFLHDVDGRPIITSKPILIRDAGKLAFPDGEAARKGLVNVSRKLESLDLTEECKHVKFGYVRIARLERKIDPALRKETKEKVLDQKRVANPTWLMDLRLRESETPNESFILEGTVFNRPENHRQQKPVVFVLRLRTKNNAILTHRLRIPGEIINAGAARPFKFYVDELDSFKDPEKEKERINDAVVEIVSFYRLDGGKELVSLNKLDGVDRAGIQQELDWRTVPIKRIDAVELGKLAHESSDRKSRESSGLFPYEFLKKAGTAKVGDGVAPPAPAVADTAPSSRPGGTPLPPGTPVSPNHIEFLRYDGKPTDEVRRMPVAVVIVIDMAYLNEVHTAFANSRLRVQVTQSVWNRLPAGLEEPHWHRPVAPLPPDAPPGAVPATAPARPPIIDHNQNLIRLQVYGVASIYESPDAKDRRDKEKADDKKPAGQ